MITLQKCIDELKKDSPNVPYILGMLETYLELSGNVSSPIAIKTYVDTMSTKNIDGLVKSDDDQLPPGYATGIFRGNS